jgi:hypothetical protein
VFVLKFSVLFQPLGLKVSNGFKGLAADCFEFRTGSATARFRRVRDSTKNNWLNTCFSNLITRQVNLNIHPFRNPEIADPLLKALPGLNRKRPRELETI